MRAQGENADRQKHQRARTQQQLARLRHRAQRREQGGWGRCRRDSASIDWPWLFGRRTRFVQLLLTRLPLTRLPKSHSNNPECDAGQSRQQKLQHVLSKSSGIDCALPGSRADGRA
jgi:hypothetical protein